MLERLLWLYFSEQRLFRPRYRLLRWWPWIALAILIVMAAAPRMAGDWQIGAYR